MNLALFDFDGTITNRDSFIDFIKFAKGNLKFFQGFMILSPILILYKLKIIPNYQAKEIVITHFFKNFEFEKFKEIANEYSKEKLNSIVKPSAIERLNWHKDRGDRIVIVSASIECWLKEWVELNGFELISTKLEVKNSKLSGKLKTKNCYGIEKVNRIREKLNLNEFEKIYAYGDSRGDFEMLNLAHEKFYKYFH